MEINASAKRRILIPVDEIGSSEKAVQWYLDAVAHSGDYVVLLNIRTLQGSKQTKIWVADNETEDFQSNSYPSDQPENDPQSESHHRLAQLAEELHKKFAEQFKDVEERLRRTPGTPKWRLSNEDGGSEYNQRVPDQDDQQCRFEWHVYTSQSSNPGAVIVEAQGAMNADFVIMGTRGLGMIRRAFQGSVSDYVMHNSTRPVIIVPNINA